MSKYQLTKKTLKGRLPWLFCVLLLLHVALNVSAEKAINLHLLAISFEIGDVGWSLFDPNRVEKGSAVKAVQTFDVMLTSFFRI